MLNSDFVALPVKKLPSADLAGVAAMLEANATELDEQFTAFARRLVAEGGSSCAAYTGRRFKQTIDLLTELRAIINKAATGKPAAKQRKR